MMLLLAMISLHLLTFRLMVTMVADFCTLVILIHNTLQGEITISTTWTTRVNYTSIPQLVMIQFHLQRFVNFMVIELRWFKKKKEKKMENMDKMGKALFEILHVLYHKTTNFCILVIFHTFFTLISLKVKSTSNWKWKWTKTLYMVFNGDRP